MRPNRRYQPVETDYYILCPQRPGNAPGLITHLISVDICRRRQDDGFHKCPNCVRSDVFKRQHGEPTRNAVSAKK
jgi:hypothetical protein